MTAAYETEQDELVRQTAVLKSELEQFDSDSLRADKFLELARRHTDFSELTTPLITEFIDKVIVHEADKSSGKREQRVDIYLNFIGQFEAPDEAAPDDTDGEEKRAMWREYKRNERAKKKLAEKEQTA